MTLLLNLSHFIHSLNHSRSIGYSELDIQIAAVDNGSCKVVKECIQSCLQLFVFGMTCQNPFSSDLVKQGDLAKLRSQAVIEVKSLVLTVT